jgi:cytochrome c oxidase subunit 3
MNYTNDSELQKIQRAKKNMLWFGMISLTMSFAGLTSAYVISRERKDWLTDFEIPQAFYVSLGIIVLSSISFYFAKQCIQKNENRRGMTLLLLTLLLGIAFVFYQFKGFSEIISNGYFFTGSESSITTSFIYLAVLMHLAHIFVAILTVMVVIYNHYKLRYQNGKTLGIELSVTFWHFVDVLWIYLFLFLYFVR